MNYFNIDCYEKLKRVYGEDFVTKINEEFVINAVEKQKKICFNDNPKNTDGISLKKEWELLKELFKKENIDIDVDSFEINYQNEEIELWKLVFVKEI